jgi:hypothetical protein
LLFWVFLGGLGWATMLIPLLAAEYIVLYYKPKPVSPTAPKQSDGHTF